MSPRLRVPLQLLAALIVSAAALLFAASLYLHAPWGGAPIAALLQERISAGIAGELRIDRVTISGLLRLRFEGVAFVDPEGRLAIAVDEVAVDLRILGLLQGRLDVEELLLEGARVEVATAGGGIGGVFGRRQGAGQGAPPDTTDGEAALPPPPLPIRLRTIRIEGGSFRLVPRPGAAESISLVRGLEAAGEGGWEEGLAWIRLDIGGALVHPLQRRLEVGARGRLRDGWLRAEPVTIRIGASHLAIGGGLELGANTIVASIEGTIDPAEAGFLGVPLAQALPFTASFGAAGEAQRAAVRAGTAGGGALDLAASRVGQAVALRLDFQGIDPARWSTGAPAGRLSGAAVVDGRLRPLGLTVHLELEEGRLLGERVGPGLLEGRLRQPPGAAGGLEAVLERGTLELEGAGLQASGAFAADRAELQAELRIGSLALLRPLLEELGGASLEGLQGEGELRAALRGSPRAAELLLDAKMETFALGALRANSVSLRGSGRMGADGFPIGALRGSIGRLAWDELHLSALRLDAAREEGGAFRLGIEPAHDPAAREAPAGGAARTEDPAKAGGRLRLDTRGRILPDELHLHHLDASFRGLGLDLALEGSGQLRGGRAAGELAAAAGGIGLVRATFDLPLAPASVPGSSPILLHLVAAPLDLVGLGPFVGVDLPIVRLRGALDLRGPIGAPALEVEAQLRSLEIPGQPQLPPLDARLHGAIRGKVVDAGLELWDGGARIAEVAASGPMNPERLRRDPAGALSLLLGSDSARIAGKVAGLDLALLGAALDMPELQGAAAADFDLRGPLRDPRGSVHAELRGGPAGPLPILHAKASAELQAQEVKLLATLHLPTPPAGEATSRRIPGQAPGEEIRDIPTGRSLERLGGASEINEDKGEGAGDEAPPGEAQGADGLGPPLTLALRIGASPATLLSGKLVPSTPIDLAIDLDAFDLASVATGAGRKLVTRVDALAGGGRSRRPRGRVVRIRGDQGQPGATDRGGQRRSAGGEGSGERLQPPGADAASRRQGPSEELEPEHLLEGLISFGATVRGTLAAPRGMAHLHARSLAWEGIALGDAELRLELEETRLDARLHAIDAALGSFAAILHLGPGFSPIAIAEGGMKRLLPIPLTLRMDADRLSIAPLGAILGANRTSGLLSLDLEADAPVARLQPTGSLRLEDASVEISGGLLYRELALHLRLEEERLELSRFEGRAAGGGSFALSGEIGAPGAKPFETLLAVISQSDGGSPTPFHAGIRARRLPVGGPGGVAAKVSLDGGLEGSLDPRRGVVSTLTLASTFIELPARSPRALQAVGRPDDIIVVSGPKAEAPSTGPAGERSRLFPLELQLRTSDPLRLESPDVKLEARIDLAVRRGRDGAAVAEGTARTTQGTATALGRTFDVERAVVRWLNDPVANPHLEITARYDARQAVAWADVGGTARNPTISLRSDPPLPESQIVSLILSGRTQNPGLVPVENAPLASGGAATQPGAGAGGSVSATSVIGAALTQKLGQALGPRVPVSVLASESAAGQPLVEAGTLIFGRLYLGFVRNFLPEPGENANEVRAEYELSRTVGVETRFGDAAAGGVDVVWQKSFETPQQQRARKAAAKERGDSATGSRPP